MLPMLSKLTWYSQSSCVLVLRARAETLCLSLVQMVQCRPGPQLRLHHITVQRFPSHDFAAGAHHAARRVYSSGLVAAPEERVVLVFVTPGNLPGRLPAVPALPHARQRILRPLLRRRYASYVCAQRLKVGTPHRRRTSPLVIQRRVLHHLILRSSTSSVRSQAQPLKVERWRRPSLLDI